MLSAPQEHIARHRPFDSSLKSSVAIEENHRSPILGTAMEEKRADHHIAKTHDPPR